MSKPSEIYLPSLARKVNLKKWFNVDKKKPKKGQRVLICDADFSGWADYELPVKFDGKDFILKNFGPVRGASYWKPRR